jgi:hypothetical protein
MADLTVRKQARYLVELSVPGAAWNDIDRLIRKARASANEPRSQVRFVRGIYVPEDSSCFLLYEARSARSAAAAARTAELVVERVSRAAVLRRDDAQPDQRRDVSANSLYARPGINRFVPLEER